MTCLDDLSMVLGEGTSSLSTRVLHVTARGMAKGGAAPWWATVVRDRAVLLHEH